LADGRDGSTHQSEGRTMTRNPKSKAKSAPPRRRGRSDEQQTEHTTDVIHQEPVSHEPPSKEMTPMNTIAEGAQLAQQNYEKIFGATRERVEKASQTAFKTVEEMQKLSKDNLEAYVQASTIVAKGFEQLGKAWMAFTQEALEQSAAAAKALLGAKSVREAVDLQTEWAKASFDKFVAESTKLSEQSVKVANEAFEPINARFTVAVEKLWKPVAA
jgi:phasin family protein